MYAWIFRHLPGPLWLRIFEAMIIIAAICYLLLEFGFPWLHDNFEIVNNTVDIPTQSATPTP